MKAPKLRGKLLAGILCVSMLIQNVPMNVNASESSEIVDETEAVQIGETETAVSEPETLETESTEIQSIEEKSSEPETTQTEISEVEAVETEAAENETDSDADVLKDNADLAAEIDMNVEFPDDVFREKLLEQLNVEENGSVTEDMLASVTSINFSRNSFEEPAIKDIKGIALLKGLVSIDLSYNEISDVSSIAWSELSELESINLSGNEISVAPNFYQNRQLSEVNLSENLLTAEQIRNFKSSGVPNADVTLPDDTLFSQRADGFQVRVEEAYYVYGNAVAPVTVMVGGYKSGLQYNIAFQLDNNDVEFVHKEIDGKTYENIYWIADTGLEVGVHSILITVEQDGKILGEVTRTFNIETQDYYPAKSSYSFSTNSVDDVIDLYYTYNPQNSIDHVTLTDDTGKEYLYPNVSFSTSVETRDYRYTDIEGNAGLYMTEGYMNHTAFSMKGTINVLPTGTYDLNVFLKDGTQYSLQELIRVRSSVTDNWSYSISAEILYYNDDERNTATISVTGTDNTAKFEVDDTTVATIEVDDELQNTAKITAVGEGSAVIQITVGNSIRRVEITVLERTYSNVLYMDTSELIIEGTQKTSEIDVEVLPPAALEIREELEITSSDTNVFIIENQTDTEKGTRISIKSVGVGTAILTVKVKNKDLSISRSITVTEGSFSEFEKETLLKRVGTLYCITNVNGTRLGDLELPEGWEWVNPETELTVLNNAPAEVQRYSARYTQNSYVPFTMPIPVAVTQITGLSVSGVAELTTGHEGTYSVSLTYKGYYVESNSAFVAAVDSVVSFEWSADSIFVLNESNGRSITLKAASVQEVTNGVVRVSATIGEEVLSEEYDVLVLTEHITQIKITPTDENVKKPVAYRYNEDENVVYVNEAGVSDQAYMIRFVVCASTDDNEVEVKKGTFAWTINDPALGEIKEAADGTVQLYIYGSGTIIMRATANDVGEKYAEIAIEVRDYSPILETNTIILNKYAQNGTELPVYSIEGNEIVSIGINNDNFDVKRINGKWVILIVDKDSYPKNTTVDAQLTIKTLMGSSVSHRVNLIIDTSKPKISFVQTTAPNLFYADTTAEYAVNTDYDIVSITQNGDKETGFSLVSYDKETGILTLRAKGLNKSTLSGFKNKNSDYCNVSLLVKYDGYGTQVETIKVTAKSKKPSLKVQEIAVTSTAQTAFTYLTDSATKKKMSLSGTCKVSSLTDTITAERSGNNIAVAYSGQKSKSYKILVSDENWTEDLKLSGKITVVKNLSTLLDTKKISLNMAHNIEQNGSVAVQVSAKNSTVDIADVEYEAANAKTKALIDSGYLKLSYDKNALNIGLGTDIPSGIKAGSYKLKVSAVVQGEAQERINLTSASLTISLVDVSKSPKVKLSGKGQINLIDRGNTSVVYTPSISNMTSSIKSVEEAGECAGLFDAKLTEDGKIEVKAVEGVTINTVSYVLGLELKFKNNTTVPVSVKIKPVNKTPKLEAGKKTANIYKAANNEVKWQVYNRGGFGEITDIVLTENEVNQNFVLTRSEQNQVTLKLADSSKRTIKKGKYTVIYQVKFKDMALNAKPVTMKMTITIK